MGSHPRASRGSAIHVFLVKHCINMNKGIFLTLYLRNDHLSHSSTVQQIYDGNSLSRGCQTELEIPVTDGVGGGGGGCI